MEPAERGLKIGNVITDDFLEPRVGPGTQDGRVQVVRARHGPRRLLAQSAAGRIFAAPRVTRISSAIDTPAAPPKKRPARGRAS